MNKTKLFLLSIFLSGCHVLLAQSAFLPAGGEATGVGGTASFSLGQVAYTTDIGDNIVVIAGVQQPYELFIPTDIEVPEIPFSLEVFPNPTTDILTIKVKDANFHRMNYTLSSLSGKLLKHNTIDAKDTFISLSGLARGTYLLSVHYSKNLIQTFKIIKNQ